MPCSNLVSRVPRDSTFKHNFIDKCQVPRLIGLHAPPPNTPESPMAVHPLPRRRWQASAVLAGWPLSLYVTRPNRVRFRCGSQFRLARLRLADYSNSTRLLGYLGERVIPRVSSFQLTR